jgi:membrane protease YdiL (CAAX protease family)
MKHTESTQQTWLGIRFQPDRSTLIAFTSYLLVVAGLYLAFQVFTTDRVAANFITFGPISIAGLGVVLPVLYMTLGEHRPLKDLGITLDNIIPSLLLGGLLAWDTYRNTLATLDITWGQGMVPLVAMVLAVGLFESIFFRGWLQLRFEEAFGVVPGLLLAALCYALYHIGYGMEPGELTFLFFLGLTFGAMFRLTRNIFLLWPFYTPMGSLYTNLMDGRVLPFEATYGFLLTLGLMIAVIVTALVIAQRRQAAETPSQQLAIHRA